MIVRVAGRSDHDLGEIIIAYIVIKETGMDNLFTFYKRDLLDIKYLKIIKVEKYQETLWVKLHGRIQNKTVKQTL